MSVIFLESHPFLRTLSLLMKIFSIPSLISFFLIAYDVTPFSVATLKNVEIIDFHMTKKRSDIEYFINLKTEKEDVFYERVSHDFYNMAHKGNIVELDKTFFLKETINIKLKKGENIIFEEKNIDFYFMILVGFFFLYTLFSFRLENKYIPMGFLFFSIPMIEFAGVLLLLVFFGII